MLHYSNLFICKYTNKSGIKLYRLLFLQKCKLLFLHTAYLLRTVWVESIFVKVETG